MTPDAAVVAARAAVKHGHALSPRIVGILLTELDARGVAIERVRELHQSGHECPSAEDNCGWWPVGDCPTIWILDGRP